VLRSVVIEGAERGRNVNNLWSQLDRPSIDESVRAVDRAEVVGLWQLDANRCPVVSGGNIENVHLSTNRSRSPIGVVDLDLTLADNPGHDGYVPERHPGIRLEAQNASGPGYGASVIETRGGGPPTPGIAKQLHARQSAREGNALRVPTPSAPGNLGRAAEQRGQQRPRDRATQALGKNSEPVSMAQRRSSGQNAPATELCSEDEFSINLLLAVTRELGGTVCLYAKV
jgi:hypothetical protein